MTQGSRPWYTNVSGPSIIVACLICLAGATATCAAKDKEGNACEAALPSCQYSLDSFRDHFTLTD